MEETRILIADDHQIVLDGLKNIFQGKEGYRVVADANNGEEAIDICKNLSIDVVLMDVDMPVMDGVEATKKIKADYPQVKVLVLSMHNEKSVIESVVEVGADGYMLKNSSQKELLTAVDKVKNGEKYFSADVTMTLLNKNKSREIQGDGNELKGLTEREIEILRLIAEGYSNKEIGEQLFISHRTVDTHRTNLMKKLDVHNIAGLIRIALKNKLV